jgi:hypothetical protein
VLSQLLEVLGVARVVKRQVDVLLVALTFALFRVAAILQVLEHIHQDLRPLLRILALELAIEVGDVLRPRGRARLARARIAWHGGGAHKPRAAHATWAGERRAWHCEVLERQREGQLEGGVEVHVAYRIQLGGLDGLLEEGLGLIVELGDFIIRERRLLLLPRVVRVRQLLDLIVRLV